MTSMGAVKEIARGSHLLFREEATGDLSGKVTFMSDMEAKKDPAMGRSEGREIQGEGTACVNILTDTELQELNGLGGRRVWPKCDRGPLVKSLDCL